MGVHAATPDALDLPLGVAFPVGWIADDRGAVATYRLVVGQVEQPGRFVCVARRFIPTEAWA